MMEIKTENYKFFQHKDCEFFPCHKVASEESFNCLFCYCPLYALGTACKGNFKILENGCKDCSDCTIPHSDKGYDYIMSKFGEIIEVAKENSK